MYHFFDTEDLAFVESVRTPTYTQKDIAIFPSKIPIAVHSYAFSHLGESGIFSCVSYDTIYSGSIEHFITRKYKNIFSHI